MVDVVNIEYMLPFIGIILVVFSSVYLCCKKMDILRNEENERNGNERNERNGNETVNLLPEYKLRDDPPAYE